MNGVIMGALGMSMYNQYRISKNMHDIDDEDINIEKEKKSEETSAEKKIEMFDRNKIIRRRRSSRIFEKNFSIQPFGNYSEARRIMEAIKDDPILMKFFKSIEDEARRIDNIDSEKVGRSVEEKLKLQSERVSRIDILIKEIRDSGLELEIYNQNIVTIGVPVNESKENSFINNGKYAIEKKILGLQYNGMILEEKWFTPENRQINPFEEEYNKWLEKLNEENIKDIDKEVKKARKQWNKYSKKSRGIFGTELDFQRRKESYERYEKLQERKKKGENLKRDKENLDKMTVEQKEKIYEIFKLIKECKQTGKDIDIEKEVYLSLGVKIDSNTSMVDIEKAECKRRKWKRVIKNLKQKGEITEKMIETVDATILELSLGNKNYSKENIEYEDDNVSKNILRVISAYLRERITNIKSNNKIEEKRKNGRSSRIKNRVEKYIDE